MVMLSSDVVMRRLQDIHAPTQEAIETMSLWIMHYKDKASIDVIVEGWINSFRIASTDQKRIALFYVMNDVVQKAKNKHIDTLIPAFQPAVLTAVGIGRKFDRVKEVMKRCIEIFRTRQVFTSVSITAMENLLEAGDIYDAEETVLDIDSEEIVRKITAFIAARNVVSDMMRFVNEGDFDYREKLATGMKDREEGAFMLEEIHDAIKTIVDVRHSMEDQKKKMNDLIETLELAKRVYMHQKREVLVVEEAYVNFRDGIKSVHNELVEMEQTGVYPGLTPPREAPSPTAEDDIYATGVERVIQHFRDPETWDNRQAIDMDMDEEDKPQASIPKPLLQNPSLASQPSLQSRILQLGLKQIAEGEQEPKDPRKVVQDFSKPPPNMAKNTGFSAFGVPPNLQNAAKIVPQLDAVKISRSEHLNIQQILNSLPSKAATNTNLDIQIPQQKTSTYQMALLQHGIPSGAATGPAAGQQQVGTGGTGGYTGSLISPVQPSVQPSAYQAHFEPRDPRIVDPRLAPKQQQPATQQMGYQAKFEEAQPQPQMISPQGYQARFDGRGVGGSIPNLVSPGGGDKNNSSSGGYQARFEHHHHQQHHSQHHRSQDHDRRYERRSSPPSRRDHHYGGGDRDRDRDRGSSGGYRRDSSSGDRRDRPSSSRFEDSRGGRGGRGGGWRGDRGGGGYRGGWRGGANNRY